MYFFKPYDESTAIKVSLMLPQKAIYPNGITFVN
jgi:hypothetical protein